MCRNLFVGFAALVLGLSATAARGQDSLLDELYGRGVHAYFSRDFAGARAALSSAIDGGSRDPRAYYFRGLTSLALGKSTDADVDFKKGAALEVAATDRAYGVPRALERIQGTPRRMLENERQIARVSARQKVVERNKTRYEQLQSAEGRVLRGEGAPPAPGVIPNAPAASDPDDPFSGVEGAVPGKAPAVAPGVKPTPAEDEVPEPGTKPAPPAEGDDPFGEAKPAAPAKMPEKKPDPAPPAGDDPFGEAKPAAPAAPAPPAAPAAPEKKPEPAPPAEGDDPFGEAKPAAPAAPAPPAAPAAPEKKPAPAAPPADDDPFAEPKGAAAAPESKGSGGLFGSMFRAVGKSLPGGAAPVAAPAGAPPAKGAGDPFADDPAPGKPAPKAPDKPAAPAADDDPFK